MRYIADFQIRTYEGQIILAPIEDLEILVNHIREYGVFDIAKVSFYITDDEHPMEFRNVIIRQRSDQFVPEFCEDTPQAIEQDWALVAQVLRYGNLDDMFVQYIRQPI